MQVNVLHSVTWEYIQIKLLSLEFHYSFWLGLRVSPSHLHCWGRNPCPDRTAPGSPVAPPPHHRPPPSPLPPGQRNGGGADPAGPGRGRVRRRSDPPSSAAGGVRVRSPRGLQGSRHLHFRAAAPTSGSGLRPPCPSMAASRASRRRRARRRGGRCHRMSRWPTAGWQRSLQRKI